MVSSPTTPTAFWCAWNPTPRELGGALVTAATAGEVLPEAATSSALAVRWPIRGDHNGNAAVEVFYRRAGAG